MSDLRSHLYGLIIGVGLVSGFWMAEAVRKAYFSKKQHLSRFEVWDGLWWVVIPGIVAARLYHVAALFDYYRVNPLFIIQVWRGGLSILGGLLGGALGLWYFARKKGIRFLLMTDLAAFGLPLAQAIGRWGNFFNQELYGRETSLPWGIRIDSRGNDLRFHPLFIYESFYNLLIFALLFITLKKTKGRLNEGSFFLIYLSLYGFARFLLEGLRFESWVVGGLNIEKTISALFGVAGVLGFLLLNRDTIRCWKK